MEKSTKNKYKFEKIRKKASHLVGGFTVLRKTFETYFYVLKKYLNFTSNNE